ncbi:MAG: hypothetical protein ACOYOB_21285 [Myxococcota bacterium]
MSTVDWSQITNETRAMQSLAGICEGLALDKRVSDDEATELARWLLMYENLLDRWPFSQFSRLLTRITLDDRIDEAEREELLDWCQRYIDDESVAVRTTTDALRRLHGVLHGVAADGRVTAGEVTQLARWLGDYEAFSEVPLFRELRTLIDRVLDDGHIDASEYAELLAFCRPFVERPATTKTTAPVGHTLTSNCDPQAKIAFAGKTFLFTGQARQERARLRRAVEARGGLTITKVRPNLDYLVVGALSQPAWAYAAYGRKIEAVLAMREAGKNVAIVHEDVLMRALAEGLEGAT